MDVVDLFHRGGITMYPILVCSIAAVTVFCERLWALRRSRLMPKRLLRGLKKLVGEGNAEDALQMCAKKASAFSRIARAGLENRNRGADRIRLAISETGAQETAGLDRYQSVLGTVAYLCPLLGLFGTVSGMIKAFDVISQHTVVDPPLLAAGISEALVTTMAGLAVAIPAVVMDRYVERRSIRLARDLEKESVSFAETLIAIHSDESSASRGTHGSQESDRIRSQALISA